MLAIGGLCLWLLTGLRAVYLQHPPPKSPTATANHPHPQVNPTVPTPPPLSPTQPLPTPTPASAAPGTPSASPPPCDLTITGTPLSTTTTAAPSSSNLVRVTRILRTNFKYPLVRIEELQRQDAPSSPAVVINRAIMVADHVLIRTQPNVSTARLRSLCARHHVQIRKTLASPGYYLLSTSDPNTLPSLIANLSAETNTLRYAEPDHILHTTGTLPNDPNFANLWGLHNTGQSGGTADADIDAPEAWDISTGSPTVVVGIVDSGTDLTHPDLASNIWVNPMETLNGLDDDGNGYIDDIHGWDFVANDNDPSDANSHGTHVAGTIAATGNNFQGIVGVTWRCRIMPLRFLDAAGNGSTSDALDALHYASSMRRRGVNIRATNNSWGGGGDQALSDAIRENGDAGILFIAAAGNSSGNNDANPFLPASYPWDNIIAVASTDRRDNLSSFSCYGATSVDLAAPGSEIYSTIPGGYGLKNGTSMATPHVTGVAALLWSEWPDADCSDIRNAILNGTDPIPSLAGRTVTGGRLNAHKALLNLFHIAHAPRQNTFNTGAPYPITASIAPLALVDTNQLWLFWNTDDSTNFTASSLTHDATNRFTGTIPVQPEGTAIGYWLKAVSSTGAIVTHPTNAPAVIHHFTIMPALDLTVSGTPAPQGTVTPDYGSHPFPSNMMITATASPYSTPSNNARWACLGWTGSGSTPATGNSNTTSFTLSQPSSIEWIWSREYALPQTSSIPGILATTTWWSANTTGTTLTATDTRLMGGTNYVFTHWSLDESRQPDPSLPAVNPVTGILMDAPHHAVAFYLPETLDADGDGMNDWWEYRVFGSTNTAPDADTDGDGFLNLAEFRDRTSPRQLTDFPVPPVIQHTPMPDPQDHPAPFPLSAIVTDNFTVAQVTFEWSKSGGPIHSSLLLPGETAGLYSAELPAPGTNGDVFTYCIIARDPLGLTSTNGPNLVHVNYPLLNLSPASLSPIIPPHSTTNLPLLLTNTGNTNLLANITILPDGYSNTFDAPFSGWSPSGAGDPWTLTTNRAFSAPSAWYAGNPATRLYSSSMHACLDTPPLYLGSTSQMTFRHWIKCELDTQYTRYGWKPGHAWDGGIVEISTNGGIAFAQIAPTGGYPYAISGWSESPWPEGTPCFANTGGWNQATFDLSPFASRLVIIRFHFGSDSNTEEEGWYLDDLMITHEPTLEPWLSCDPTNVVVAPSSTATVTVSFASGNIPTGNREAAVQVACNDPTAPLTIVPQTMRVRSSPILSWITNARPATNGTGSVTLSNTVFDADGDLCGLELNWSTDGASWTAAWVRSAITSTGIPTVNNTSTPQVVSITTLTNALTFTNRLTTCWDSSASGNGLGYSTTTRLRARLWDGLLWSPWSTSQTFTVDNIPPPPPPEFTNITHAINSWSTNCTMALEWRGVHDTGVGLDGYYFSFSNNTPGYSSSGFTTHTSGRSPPLPDSSNCWASLYARDRYGNSSPVQTLGPFRIDTRPPSSTGAVITLSLDPAGTYLIGTNSITGSWTGFSDAGSGIARYICALTNRSPSTNSQCTLTPSATLTGIRPDATNVLSVWAVDNLGLVGTAASMPFLALSPNGDWDADGMLNASENTAGTDPAKPGSLFLLNLQSSSNSGIFILRWPSLTNRLYTLAQADTLLPQGTNWTLMTNWIRIPGVAGTMICTDQVENIPARFYRITVEKP